MKLHGDAIGPLEGVVEVDEIYLGGKPLFVQGVTNPRGKGTKKSCVHVAVERQGEVKADVVPGDSYPDLVYRVAQMVSPDAHLMIDQLPIYKAIGKEYAAQDSVTHGSKEFCRDYVHVNMADPFNAIFERAKPGVFHHLSARHLSRYIGEVAFRWNNRDPVEKKTKKRRFKDRYAGQADPGTITKHAEKCRQHST
jgi:hypothetical protein